MSYQSLYRRYRPRRFADVRGQQHVKAALLSAIRNGTVGHAYLFSGPRGTGKTTSARLLAKALNCIDLQDGEPCGVCESCVAMDSGRSYDLFELDAASNNGVEAMRDLIAKAAVGSPGATKVYILDEVHMLSTAASNALLKTLEEPPDHVKFVLATTDPQKVLPTIKSRTQHFSFELLNAAELEEYVRWILADQDRQLSDEAIAHVVRLGRGSARDTVSALEQVLATGGLIATAASVDEIVDALANEDVGAALVAVDSAIGAGRDPRVLAETIVAALRDVFLVSMGTVGAHLPPADLANVEAWARTMRPARCARALELLGQAIVEMRQSAEPRIPLEVAVIRLSQPSLDSSVEALLDRIERLEAKLDRGVAHVPAADDPQGLDSSVTADDGRETDGRQRPPSREDSVSAAPSVAPPPTRSGEREAAPPAVGSKSPAEEAKRRLAELKGSVNRPDSPSAPPAPPPRVRPARPEVEGVEPTGDSSEPPVREVTPAASATPESPATVDQEVSEGPELAEPVASPPRDLADTFARAVHERLRGRAKALFSGARVAEVSGNRIVLAFSNSPTLAVAEQHADEVTAAVSAEAGSTIELVLTTDDDPSPRSPRPTTHSPSQRPGAATGGPPDRPKDERPSGQPTAVSSAPSASDSGAQPTSVTPGRTQPAADGPPRTAEPPKHEPGVVSKPFSASAEQAHPTAAGSWPRPALRLVRGDDPPDVQSEEAELLGVDIDDLEDAPDTQSATERIIAVFPGSSRIER